MAIVFLISDTLAFVLVHAISRKYHVGVSKCIIGHDLSKIHLILMQTSLSPNVIDQAELQQIHYD